MPRPAVACTRTQLSRNRNNSLLPFGYPTEAASKEVGMGGGGVVGERVEEWREVRLISPGGTNGFDFRMKEARKEGGDGCKGNDSYDLSTCKHKLHYHHKGN